MFSSSLLHEKLKSVFSLSLRIFVRNKVQRSDSTFTAQRKSQMTVKRKSQNNSSTLEISKVVIEQRLVEDLGFQ